MVNRGLVAEGSVWGVVGGTTLRIGMAAGHDGLKLKQKRRRTFQRRPPHALEVVRQSERILFIDTPVMPE